MTSRIPIPFHYSIVGTAPRDRNPSRRYVRDIVEADIAEYSAADIEWIVDVREGNPRSDVRLPVIAGRIWRPTVMVGSKNGIADRPQGNRLTVAEAGEVARRMLVENRIAIAAPFFDIPHFDYDEPFTTISKAHQDLYVPRDTEFRDRLWDDRSESLAEALRAGMEDTIVIDGHVHTSRCEPLWHGVEGSGRQMSYVRWIPAARPVSELAVGKYRRTIMELGEEIDPRSRPIGDVDKVGSRIAVARVALSRLLQECAQSVFSPARQEDGFFGSATFSVPDVSRDLDDAVRAVSRVVRKIDALTVPGFFSDDISEVAGPAADALALWLDAVASQGLVRGQAESYAHVVGLVEEVRRALPLLVGQSRSVRVAETEVDPDLAGFRM